jgi:hypothetical protein
MGFVVLSFASLVFIPVGICGFVRSDPKPQATDSVAFAVAAIFLFPLSAQKTHVKPQNDLNITNEIGSSWYFS